MEKIVSFICSNGTFYGRLGTETRSEIPVTCLSPQTLCLDINSSTSYQQGPRSAPAMGTGPLLCASTSKTLPSQLHFCFQDSPNISSKEAKYHDASRAWDCWRCFLLVSLFNQSSSLHLGLSHIDRSLYASPYW